MLLLKLPQHLHLLFLVTSRLTHLLLPLIIHHFLYHGPRLTIQVAEFAVFGANLRGVNFGSRGDDVRPPFHLIDFVEVDSDFFTSTGGFECPGGFIGVYGFGEVTLGTRSVSNVLRGDREGTCGKESLHQ